jgi:uncharacterized integral membrane protein
MVQTSPTDTTPGHGTGKAARLSGGVIAALVGLALLVIVVIQNSQRVTVDFLFWSFTWPIWLFALAMAVVGALVWFGLGVVRRHRRRQSRRS